MPRPMLRSLLRLLVPLVLLPFAAQAAAPLPVLAVALEKRPAGTFYVNGAIEGYGELNLLVDTGASMLAINDDIFSQLQRAGMVEYSYESGVNMADGTFKPVRVYRIAALRIGASCWIHDVETTVLPSSARAILGMNVLSRLSPFTFSAEPPQITLNQCSAAPAPETSSRKAGPTASQIAKQ